ncbi:MAG TPA: SET domain-containing protein-lysine N-methyltransferase [Gemmatimonadaceae bacterium]
MPTTRKSSRPPRTAPSKRASAPATAPTRGAGGDAIPDAQNPWFELRRSPIQGLGAFATKRIPKGTRIIEYTGEKISNEEADRRYDDTKMRRHHTFLFILNSKWILDAAHGGGPAKYINHSCDPNCEAVTVAGRRIYIEAIRTIQPGEELLYDYQYERTEDHTAEDEEFYRCLCGAPNCRGTILAPPAKPAPKKKAAAKKKQGAAKKKRGTTAKKKSSGTPPRRRRAA